MFNGIESGIQGIGDYTANCPTTEKPGRSKKSHLVTIGSGQVPIKFRVTTGNQVDLDYCPNRDPNKIPRRGCGDCLMLRTKTPGEIAVDSSGSTVVYKNPQSLEAILSDIKRQA